MEFEWDDAKSEACFHERGFDFEYAAQAFFDPQRQVAPDTRRAYGEDRFLLVGRIAHRVFVVVYTPRAGACRITQPARPTDERCRSMTVTRKKIESAPSTAIGRIDARRVDATGDADIARQGAADERDAVQDAAQFAQRVRHRMGLSQAEFALRIEVSIETIRNWEQGKRSPTGAAKALLRLLDKAPELALQTLR